MKIFSYILTGLLLVVNMHFSHVYATDRFMETNTMDCSIRCCDTEKMPFESEKPNCCSDSFCSLNINSAFAINYTYSPKIPINKNVKEFLPLVYTYTNFYTLSHTDDFWNPPKI